MQTAGIFTWYIGVALIVAAAELRWPAGGHADFAQHVLNFAIAAADVLLLTAFTLTIAWLPESLRVHGLLGTVFGAWHPKGIVPLVLATIAYAVVWDFFQYWGHRLQHRFPILWGAHIVHHDDENMNSTTALRRSFPEHLLNYLLIAVPTFVVCGLEMLPLYGGIVLFWTWGFVNHANVRLDFGPLTPLISGPQWHRLHHDRASGQAATNFAAFFPVIDIIFGTYRKPGIMEFPQTGVCTPSTTGEGAMALVRAVFLIPRRRGATHK